MNLELVAHKLMHTLAELGGASDVTITLKERVWWSLAVAVLKSQYGGDADKLDEHTILTIYTAHGKLTFKRDNHE
jgi:hypothetical protein